VFLMKRATAACPVTRFAPSKYEKMNRGHPSRGGGTTTTATSGVWKITSHVPFASARASPFTEAVIDISVM